MRIQVANFLAMLIHVYSILIILYALTTWVESFNSSVLRFKPVRWLFRFLRDVSEPFLGLFRRIIPPLGVMDITPLVAILMLQFVGGFLVRIIAGA